MKIGVRTWPNKKWSGRGKQRHDFHDGGIPNVRLRSNSVSLSPPLIFVLALFMEPSTSGRHSMNIINEIEQQLVDRYKRAFRQYSFPCWAYRYYPPVPHVGNNIIASKLRCLVYGSAENLTYTRNRPSEEINRLNEEQWYRHRYFRKYDNYFPHAHIQPIKNGSLLIAARYILALLGYDTQFSNEPKKFFEEISVGNFGKYSIDSETNRDYADKYKYLKASLEYVSIDLDVIAPDILILPRKIYELSSVRKVILSSLKQGSRIVPIYQTNRLAIGGRSFKAQIEGCKPTEAFCFSFEPAWLNSISDSGINSDEMKRYLGWLNCRINQIIVEVKS